MKRPSPANPLNPTRGIAGAMRGHPGMALTAMACVSLTLANETVIPLVVPSMVPQKTKPADNAQNPADSGFTGPSAPEAEAQANPGLSELPGLPDRRSEDLLLTPDTWDDVGPPDDALPPDAGDWLNQADPQGGGNLAADTTDPVGLPGGWNVAPSISDSWLSGNDAHGNALFTPGSVMGNLRQGLSMSLSLSGTYDTNPSRGFGNAGNDSGGDFSLMLGGGISYQSRASTWTYGVNYSGGYRLFFDQSDLNGYSQNAGASINYTGGPLTAGLSLGMDFGSGANRNVQAVTDTININYALNARYQISSKTTVTGDFSQSLSTASGQGNRDTGSFNASVAGLWKYSPLTEFGPGIRYTRRSQDSGPTLTSIGPTFNINYKLSAKISLNSSVGMDYVSVEGGGSQDPSLFSSIGVNYRASTLWGMNLQLLRDNRASFNADGQFEEVTALRIGYTRKIRRASWNLGMGWESTSVSNNVGVAAAAPDRQFLTVDTSLGMNIFRNTTSASIFAAYRDDRGGNLDSNSLQFGFSLSRNF